MWPAGVAGLRVKRVNVRLELALRVIEAGPDNGPAVVLVHGWAASSYTYSETIPSLARAGYRVIAIDLPGHGLSQASSRPEDYEVTNTGTFIFSVLKQLGIGEHVLVAHSMSGRVALHLAAMPTDDMRGIVLLGAVGLGRVPSISLPRLATPRFVIPFMRPFYTRTIVRAVLRLAGGRDLERDVDEYWAPTQFNGYFSACRDYLHYYLWEQCSASDLARLHLPALVIAGARDHLVTGVAEGGRRIPGARVIELADAGHLAMQTHAERVNAELLKFLDGVSPVR